MKRPTQITYEISKIFLPKPVPKFKNHRWLPTKTFKNQGFWRILKIWDLRSRTTCMEKDYEGLPLGFTILCRSRTLELNLWDFKNWDLRSQDLRSQDLNFQMIEIDEKTASKWCTLRQLRKTFYFCSEVQKSLFEAPNTDYRWDF